jgi:SagB-type dehydrogenase family enzyme
VLVVIGTLRGSLCRSSIPSKYGLRGYRFALLEAGHVGQNLVLAATGLGLGAVPLGGYYDRPTDELLGLDGVNESTLYLVAVGRIRAG